LVSSGIVAPYYLKTRNTQWLINCRSTTFHKVIMHITQDTFKGPSIIQSPAVHVTTRNLSLSRKNSRSAS
jgi:hypothetical protein